MKIKNIIVLLIVSLIFGFLSCNSDNADKNINNTFVKDSFIDSLMNKMTIEEKIGQTVLYSAGWDITGPTLDENYVKYLKNGKLGAIFNVHSAKGSRDFQKIAVEQTRLGIPLLFGYDVIHGFKAIFPISLGEAASWDMKLIEKGARVAAVEASSAGIHWTFAPMVDITRDPRWGRVSEGAGEDVYLGTQIAKARVKGFQGDDLANTNTILACAKHYAAYGAAIAGRDYNSVDMSERELRTTYLPPFKAALDSGVATFMASFNELNGVPATGNKFLMTDILRKEWGFNGFVVTDYTGINEMVAHGFAKDNKDAAKLAMNAGIDMDMQSGAYMNYLKDLIKEKKVSEKQLNYSVRKILELKYNLGLFSDPYKYCNENNEKNNILTEENLKAAQTMAEESVVLLKNEQQILPLSKNQKIALIGPLAKDEYHIIGSWAAQGDRNGTAVSVFEGISALIDGNYINYAKGCNINDFDKSHFNEAIEVVKKSDVVVMVMGEKENMSGEAASRTNLDLPGVQKKLIATIKKTGKPIILVLMNGRPLTLTYENKISNAILETWWPGTMGGTAIANVLYGNVNPSGKLPITFPRNVGQIPIYYNHKNTGRPYELNGYEQKYRSRYLDSPNSPLYPFGFGLSYTTFKYSNLTLDKKEYNFKDNIYVSVEITNTGKVAGKEVVQLYIRDLVGSVTRPVKELKKFKKIKLNPNEVKKITFTLNVNDLKFYTLDMNFKAEPGDFKLFVGTNSQNLLETDFKLIKK